MKPVIEIRELYKSYRKKPVLKGLDLEIFPGQTWALLGKNGAGKSTLIRTLLGLAYPDAGEIEVLQAKPGRVTQRIGFLSENLAIYPNLSARENIQVAVLCSGRSAASPQEILQILDRVALTDTGSKPAKSFSLGMKRRLQLAMATLTKKNDLLILDEPTNGLDLNGLHLLKEYLETERQSGTTILMATHALAEIQDVVSHYAVLEDGVIKTRGKASEWLEATVSYTLTLDAHRAQDALARLQGSGMHASLTDANHISVSGSIPEKRIHQVMFEAGIMLEGIVQEKTSLSEIFLHTSLEAAE